MKITILEPGAWGTALGVLLSKKNQVRFWYEDKKLALKINRLRENEKLAGIKIPPKIFISPDLEKTINDAELIIVASPSFGFRQTLLYLKKYRGQTPVNLLPLLGIAKGIERETLKLPSQIAEEIFPHFLYAHLSGPGFAKEIVRGKPAQEVIASKNKNLLKKLKEIFQIKPLKIQTTTDLIGIQLAAALKNALAIGISLVAASLKGPDESLGGRRVGWSPEPEKRKIKNLIRLGLKEMIKIGKAMGAKEETFLGPAGLGDLILTSTDPLSRNFQFGKNLYFNAEKMRQDIRERKITVEGFDSVWALYRLGKKYKLNLPMIEEIYNIIYKKTSPKKTIKNLIRLTEIG